MSDFLAGMAASSRARCEAARELEPLEVLRARAMARPPPRVVEAPFVVIAECKLRSPAVGALGGGGAEAVAARARAYGVAGATAVSVLTEPDRFDGALAHLEAAAAASASPTMRKDFLVDPYQVWEARAAGAGGVLLIAAMLDDDTLRACLRTAELAGLFVLLECFDEAELERAAAAPWRGEQPLWLGVNVRDLRSLQVDPLRLERLAPRLPEGRRVIAESGIEGVDDVRRAAKLGYRGALVGTALMRAADPGALVQAMAAEGAACS